MNSVNLIGNLTRTPELRTAGETPVTTLRIAFSTRAKQGEEWIDVSNYIDVTVWGRQAELAIEHLEKGRQIAVTGTLKTGEYESSKFHDGEGQAAKLTRVEVIASELTYLAKPRERIVNEDGSPVTTNRLEDMQPAGAHLTGGEIPY